MTAARTLTAATTLFLVVAALPSSYPLAVTVLIGAGIGLACSYMFTDSILTALSIACPAAGGVGGLVALGKDRRKR